MTPLTREDIRDTIAENESKMTAAVIRDPDWMIRDGYRVAAQPAPALPADIEERLARALVRIAPRNTLIPMGRDRLIRAIIAELREPR